MRQEVRQEKKATVGRHFKGDMRNRSGNYLSISFKQEDIPILEQLKRIIADDKIPISETVVDAIRLKFGVNDFSLARTVILEAYRDGELVGPNMKLVKTFDDVFEWELQNTRDPRAIADKWRISRQTMGCLAHLYFAKPLS